MSEMAGGGAAEQSQATFDRELELVTLTGERLTASAKRLRVSGEADRRICALRLEADWGTYTALTDGEWMGLAAAARGREAGGSFDPARPVELTAQLKPAVQRALWPDGAELDAEGVLRALLSEDAAARALLLHSESWLVTEVKQRVDVPEELAGGVLKQGYRTLWADGAPQPTAGTSASASRSLQAVAASYLQRAGLPAERLSEALLRVPYADEIGAWTMLVVTDEAEGVCIVYSIFPVPVAEERRADMAVFLNAENYDLALGSFELDPADGELRFRTSLDVEGDRLSEVLFARLFGTNAGMMTRYYAELAEMAGN